MRASEFIFEEWWQLIENQLPPLTPQVLAVLKKLLSREWGSNGLSFDFDPHFVKRANERSITTQDIIDLLRKTISNPTIIKRLRDMENGDKAYLQDRKTAVVGAFSKIKSVNGAGHTRNELYFHTTGGKVDPENPNTETFRRGWTANDSGPKLTVERSENQVK